MKIWFQNRRNKWKRQIATDVDGLGIGMSAAAAVAGVMAGNPLFSSLSNHFHPYHHPPHPQHHHPIPSPHPAAFSNQTSHVPLHPGIHAALHTGHFSSSLQLHGRNPGLSWHLPSAALHARAMQDTRPENSLVCRGFSTGATLHSVKPELGKIEATSADESKQSDESRGEMAEEISGSDVNENDSNQNERRNTNNLRRKACLI